MKAKRDISKFFKFLADNNFQKVFLKFLKAFFSSLNQDCDCIGEVIIIDNGSTDKSREFIKNNSFNFPVNVIENNQNRGFSPAVNQCIRAAKYEYIFSLNNDTEVKKALLKLYVS